MLNQNGVKIFREKSESAAVLIATLSRRFFFKIIIIK